MQMMRTQTPNHPHCLCILLVLSQSMVPSGPSRPLSCFSPQERQNSIEAPHHSNFSKKHLPQFLANVHTTSNTPKVSSDSLNFWGAKTLPFCYGKLRKMKWSNSSWSHGFLTEVFLWSFFWGIPCDIMGFGKSWSRRIRAAIIPPNKKSRIYILESRFGGGLKCDSGWFLTSPKNGEDETIVF